MASNLLGAQQGDEEAFASLYAQTNPVLTRYLRVVSDGDPADLTLTSWATLVRRLPSCSADDDAWLEQAVEVARMAAEDARQREGWSTVVDPDLHRPFLVLAELENPAAAAGGESAPAAAVAATERPEPDEVDRAVEALRSCPPDEADVLAMRGVARLGRGAISRFTGHDAAAVVALLDAAHDHVDMPVDTLFAALRSPARPDELADLPVVARLYAGSEAASKAPLAAAAAAAPLAAAAQPSAVDLFNWDSPAPATRSARAAARTAASAAHRSAWAGATAAAGALVIGGVAAAAYTGLLPGALQEALDRMFGGNPQRTPTAVAPPRPGPQPSDGAPVVPGGGDTGAQPPTNGETQEPGDDVEPGATAAGDSGVVTAGGAFGFPVVRVSLPEPSTLVPSIPRPPAPPTVVTPQVPNPPAPPPPAPPPPTPPPPTPKPPAPEPKPTHPGKGHAYGKDHPKHSTGQGKAYAHGKNGTQPGKNKSAAAKPPQSPASGKAGNGKAVRGA